MFAGTPLIITERLILKEVSTADISAYEKYFIDYEVIAQLSSAVPWPYPKDGVRAYLTEEIIPSQGDDRWTWGLFAKENPSELIGCIDLWREGCPENRGFWLGRPFWGRGYMTEAVFAVNHHAFSNLDFEKLLFANALGNSRSRRIKEKTGARRIDVRPAKYVSPEFTQQEIWELTKVDWINFYQKESGSEK